VENAYLPDRVGWHEVTAGGNGVALQTDLPSRSTTDGLGTYPSDPLSSPPDVRGPRGHARPRQDGHRGVYGRAALGVLLGAIALGRTWFGVLLIVAYGLGMAATLTAAGLVLLRLRDRWAWLARLNLAPAALATLIIALGLTLTIRAALTL
jgi:hypothetical protein